MVEESENKNWPIAKFYFVVDWGITKNISFQEASGLDTENQNVEISASNRLDFSLVGRPENNYATATLNKGIMPKNSDFWDWYKRITIANPKPEDVVVKLMDEQGNATMSWTFANATPVKESFIITDNGNNEIAIERVVIKY